MTQQQQQRLKLYEEPLLRDLRKIVPGFFEDKSETWYVELSRQDKHWINQAKQRFLYSLERFDNAFLAKEKRQSRDEMIDLVKEILPKCNILKEKAATNERKRFEEITGSLRKKRRVNNAVDDDNDDDDCEYDFGNGDDEYLPNLGPKEKDKRPNVSGFRGQQEAVTRSDHNQEIPMMWTPSFAGLSSNSSPPKLIPTTSAAPRLPEPLSSNLQVDDLTKGIDDEITKKLLNDLKDLILKYGCRDRVLRAIIGLKAEKENRDLLINFDSLLQKLLAK